MTTDQEMSGKAFLNGFTTSTMAIFAVILAVVATIVAVTRGDDAGAEGGHSLSSQGSEAASTDAPDTVDVSLSEFAITPGEITVAEGGTLNVVNDGAVPHDVAIVDTDKVTAMLNGGESDELSLDGLEPGTYELFCDVPGHGDAGMTATLNIGGASAEPAASGGDHSTHDEPSGAVIDANAEPAADFTPYDPALKPAPGGTEHEITFHATETELEVAPGVTQELWTFNDMVPGPVLRGNVGDIFTITLVNDGELGHSIDFHASKVAWNDEMRTIEPGESLVYQYEAKHAGVFMYHCGTAPALHHIGNGMFGAIIIDPPDLPKVDHEFVLVQSEFYLGDEGEPGDLDKMTNEQFDAVVFNGYFNQYLHKPIRVEKDERVRVFVLDAGPNENSAFHVVGTIFDTVFKEGAYTLVPDDSRGGAQVLDLQPASGGFVEFTLDEDGLYPIVTHKFANVGKGALGLFQAGEVEPTGGGH